MARILPTPLPSHVKTDPGRAAERKVYQSFSERVGGKYTVFYSVSWLGKPGHGVPPDGEIDFVVAHPDWGLLVLEVKGGRIGHDGVKGRWYSRDRYGRTHPIDDPFLQARGAKHALIRKIKEVPVWRNRWIDAGHGVIFPDAGRPDNALGTDTAGEVMAFTEDLVWLDEWIESAFRFWGANTAPEGGLGSEGVALLERLFAPTFELKHPLRSEIDADRADIIRLTEEQFVLLDFLSRKRRLAISGGAGTGKTMLALEKAQRLAEEGFRTLLTCYNRPLSDYLAQRVSGVENLTVMNFHQLCYDFASRADCPVLEPEGETPPPEYFEKELPSALMRALECLTEERFDAVIVDEGQDFAEDWWVALQLALSDPDYGILYVFFDDNQRVYSRVSNLPESLDIYPLTRNLRNTKEIHRLAKRYYEGGELKGEGPDGRPVEYLRADDGHAVEKETSRVLHRLIREEHIDPNDIAVLTGRSRENSVLAGKDAIGSFRVCCGRDQEKGKVVFDSIRRFKGLEKPIVILVELEDALDSQEILYVGLSRAQAYLVVIGSERVLGAMRGSAPGAVERGKGEN
jgi:hypothetical protein